MWGVAGVWALLLGCGGSDLSATYTDPYGAIPEYREGPGLWTADTPVLQTGVPQAWKTADVPLESEQFDALLASACQQEHRGFWKRMHPCTWSDPACDPTSRILWTRIQRDCVYPSEARVNDAIRRLTAEPPLAGGFEMARVAAKGRGPHLSEVLSVGHSSAEAYTRHWINALEFGETPDPLVVQRVASLLDRDGPEAIQAAEVLARVDSPEANDPLVAAWDALDDDEQRWRWLHWVKYSSDPRMRERLAAMCSDEDMGAACALVRSPIERAAFLLWSDEQTPSDLLDRWTGHAEAVQEGMRACVTDPEVALPHQHQCLRVWVGLGGTPDGLLESGTDPHWDAILAQWEAHGSSEGIGLALLEQGMLDEVVAQDPRFPPVHYADWMTERRGQARAWRSERSPFPELTRLVVAHPELRRLVVIPYSPSHEARDQVRINRTVIHNGEDVTPWLYTTPEVLGFLDGKRYRSATWEDWSQTWSLAYGTLLNRVAEDRGLDERVWMDASEQLFWADQSWLVGEREAGRLAGWDLDIQY